MVDNHTLHKDLTGNDLHQPFKTGTDGEKSISPVIGDWYFATDIDKLYGCVEDGVWKSIALTTTSGENQGGIKLLDKNISLVTIEFDDPFLVANYVVTLGLENTEDDPPSVYAMIVTNKTENGFKVLFSGEIDSVNYQLNWFAKAQ